MSLMESIRAAAPGETVWDKGEKQSVTGLHLRVKPDGRKSFFLYYRTRQGAQRRPKLGDLGALTLSDARGAARELLERVSRGEDPKAGWDKAKAEMTVDDLFQKVFKSHWSKPRYQESGWGIQAKQIYDGLIAPRFKSKRLSEMTPMAIRDWHGKMDGTPTQANRGMEVLSKMFNFAIENEWHPQGQNPCSLVKSFKEKKRKRYATEDEIRKIGVVLRREVVNHPAGVAFLLLLMYTGSRPKALEDATWDQLKTFDVKGETFGVLTFSGKSTEETGEDESVVLPPPAMAVVAHLPKVEGQTILGCKMPRRLWGKIKKEVGCKDLWARDLRRTFATVGMSGGTGMDVIGELLNHHSTQTTKVYAKLMENVKMASATKIAGRMEELLSLPSPDPA